MQNMPRLATFTLSCALFMFTCLFIAPTRCVTTFSPIESSPWQLTVTPFNKTEKVGTGQSRTLHVNLVYNNFAEGYLDWPEVVTVGIKLSNDFTVSLSNRSLSFTRDEIWEGDSNKTIELTATLLGVVYLDFFLEDIVPSSSAYHVEANNGTYELPLLLLDDYLVTVIRSSGFLDKIYTYSLLGSVMLNTINMGCGLDLSIVKATLFKPIGPVVGFISQFTFMPMFAFGMAWLVLDDNLLRLGLFIIGVCPGGTGSNFWTLLFNGDVNLSITMTFISTVAALGMMPFWIWMLGGYFLDGFESLVVPYDKVVQSLILLTIPLGIGLLIQRFFPRVARFLAFTFIKPFTLFIIIWQFTLGLFNLQHIFTLWDWGIAVGGMSVAWSGFLFGAFFAWIMRLSRPQIIAISLETALQNGNLGYLILKLSIPEPYSDLAALPPVTQMLMTAFTLYGMLASSTLYKCIFRRKKKNPRTTNDEEKNATTNKRVDLSLSDSKRGGLATRPLLLSSISTCTTPSDGGFPETPTIRSEPVFHGGPLTPEFRWAQRSSYLVPNSPNYDPRL